MHKTIQWDAKHNSLPINLYQSLSIIEALWTCKIGTSITTQ
ncbi:hypothetical protein VCRA2120O333_60059 [Vibrio crassostreae]|nr:hypothetical protein VCRA2113O322_10282 [Vibrio crassostreae]CAK1869677.1 hypothetical protein VCRA2113O324_10278 [Vibrio crassostreae]CAK1874687.1 hypothetical protein VCRA2113O326_10281 [Vibrio crassostreae]CAK2007342.1 hypothetical protein VCRA2111O320_20281 [Vibrio crassostreae]CAK2438009.1 hypothetical protein VCRA2114E327_10615 [Vibrio crassostreae]